MPKVMIDPEKALALVLEQAQPLPPVSLPLDRAAGRVLAEAVRADRDYPPFDRAMMDGVAVACEDHGQSVALEGGVPAGAVPNARVAPGICVEIMTGAACPPGTEAVVPKEKIKREDGRIRLPQQIKPGQHIAPRGSETRRDRVFLQPGTLLNPSAIGALASCGQENIRVIPQPTVAVITTGREIVADDRMPEDHQIRNSNGPMLQALLRLNGLRSVTCLHAEDRPASLAAALEQGSENDVVLFTGGVSAGKYDLVPERVADSGAQILFHGVKQKPGKPLLFARGKEALIFGVPGNPLAALFCVHRYGIPLLRKMAGLPHVRIPLPGKLKTTIQSKGGRARFLLGRAEWHDGRFEVSQGNGVSSADIFGTGLANCYFRLPAEIERLEAGASISFIWIGEQPWTG